MKQTSPVKSEYAPVLPAALSQEDGYCFGGFKNLNSTPIPDEFFDILAVQLSEAELRVLLYIMRRTFGFKKKGDAISLSQLTGGIRKRDGSVLDYGTGLSKPSVLKAVSGLQTKGIITIEKRTGEDGRNEINIYQLHFADETGAIQARPLTNQPRNSITEYSEIEQTSPFSPDPRFVSARPAVPTSGRQPLPETRSGLYGGQRQSGDTPDYNQTAWNQEIELTEGVNLVYHGSKASLPGAKTNHSRGKAALPGMVNSVNRGGQPEATGRVNLVNRQHGSLQESRKQVTETQTVLRANGALAYQAEHLEQPEMAANAAEELYITDSELVDAMLGLGLSEKLALDLVANYPAEYLWEKISFTRQQLNGHSHQRLVKNTAGYLRKAIEEDYRPAKPARYAQPESNRVTARFPGALAHLHRVQPAAGQYSEPYSIEENFYPEETAPLPPIYRQAGYSHAMSGESLSGRPPTPPSHSRGVPAMTSGGAERVRNFSRSTSAPPTPEPAGAMTGLWELIYEDLEGRFRLGEALELLEGAALYLPGLDDEENTVTVQLNSPWQERALGMAARSAIALAVRQRLGPGFKVTFCSA